MTVSQIDDAGFFKTSFSQIMKTNVIGVLLNLSRVTSTLLPIFAFFITKLIFKGKAP